MLSTLAVVAALTGSTLAASYAASRPVLYTSANITNNSLQSVDFKDQTLLSTNFSSAARTQLKAKTGPVGDMGPPGSTGSKGLTGQTGSTGADAVRAYSYITADDTGSLIEPKSSNLLNPPSGDPCGETDATLALHLGFEGNGCVPYAPFYPHWAWDCRLTLSKYCGFDRGGYGSAGAGATVLTSSSVGVIGFVGDANGSFVSLMRPGNIVVNATMTFLAPEFSEFHSRIMCQPQVRRSNTSDTYTNLGVPQYVSSDEPLELVHMTVTGATHFDTPGDYDYQIACRVMDTYSNASIDDWVFVNGNATATTTEL